LEMHQFWGSKELLKSWLYLSKPKLRALFPC
jgi:hypothetical protein